MSFLNGVIVGLPIVIGCTILGVGASLVLRNDGTPESNFAPLLIIGGIILTFIPYLSQKRNEFRKQNQ